jgi:hypothetical protein
LAKASANATKAELVTSVPKWRPNLRPTDALGLRASHEQVREPFGGAAGGRCGLVGLLFHVSCVPDALGGSRDVEAGPEVIGGNDHDRTKWLVRRYAVGDHRTTSRPWE